MSEGSALPAGSAASLAEIRRRLVQMRLAHRERSEELLKLKAQAELRAIEKAGGEKALGTNAESRERALILALAEDSEYQVACEVVGGLASGLESIEAELEEAKDIRREREWAISARLAEALDRRGAQSDHSRASPEDDVAFDDTADDSALRQAEEAARRASWETPEAQAQMAGVMAEEAAARDGRPEWAGGEPEPDDIPF